MGSEVKKYFTGDISYLWTSNVSLNEREIGLVNEIVDSLKSRGETYWTVHIRISIPHERDGVEPQ